MFPREFCIAAALSLIPYALCVFRHGTETKKRPRTANYVRRVWERK